MEGVTIVETEALNTLISSIESLQNTATLLMEENKKLKKQWLTLSEVGEMTGFSSTWVHMNKSIIGHSKVGNSLRFKRQDVDAFMEANYFKISNKKTHFRK